MKFRLDLMTDDRATTLRFRCSSRERAAMRVAAAADRWVSECYDCPNGATVKVDWHLADDEGGALCGTVNVHLEPDHARLIRDAYRMSSQRWPGCGPRVHDHDWTCNVEMDGGSPAHPGVNAGDGYVTVGSHCRICGLRLIVTVPDDAQLNRTVRYEYPKSFCQACDAPHPCHGWRTEFQTRREREP